MEQNEADNAAAAQVQDPGGRPHESGGAKGSNKVVVAIWVAFLLGGVSWYAYSQQKRAAEAERLLNEAYTLYGQQEFARSTELLRQAAGMGNVWAQLYYGERLKNGFYAEPDPIEAVKWLRKAAGQNCPEAFCQLGLCYENGEGVERDLNEAEKWYRKAVDDPGSAYTARTALERIETMKAKSGGGGTD